MFTHNLFICDSNTSNVNDNIKRMTKEHESLAHLEEVESAEACDEEEPEPEEDEDFLVEEIDWKHALDGPPETGKQKFRKTQS